MTINAGCLVQSIPNYSVASIPRADGTGGSQTLVSGDGATIQIVGDTSYECSNLVINIIPGNSSGAATVSVVEGRNYHTMTVSIEDGVTTPATIAAALAAEDLIDTAVVGTSASDWTIAVPAVASTGFLGNESGVRLDIVSNVTSDMTDVANGYHIYLTDGNSSAAAISTVSGKIITVSIEDGSTPLSTIATSLLGVQVNSVSLFASATINGGSDYAYELGTYVDDVTIEGGNNLIPDTVQLTPFIWNNISVLVAFPDGQTPTANTPLVNDVITDTKGQIFKITNVGSMTSNVWTLSLQAVRPLPTIEVSPDYTSTKYSNIATLVPGGIPAYWDPSNTDIRAARRAYQYNVNELDISSATDYGDIRGGWPCNEGDVLATMQLIANSINNQPNFWENIKGGETTYLTLKSLADLSRTMSTVKLKDLYGGAINIDGTTYNSGNPYDVSVGQVLAIDTSSAEVYVNFPDDPENNETIQMYIMSDLSVNNLVLNAASGHTIMNETTVNMDFGCCWTFVFRSSSSMWLVKG